MSAPVQLMFRGGTGQYWAMVKAVQTAPQGAAGSSAPRDEHVMYLDFQLSQSTNRSFLTRLSWLGLGRGGYPLLGIGGMWPWLFRRMDLLQGQHVSYKFIFGLALSHRDQVMERQQEPGTNHPSEQPPLDSVGAV